MYDTRRIHLRGMLSEGGTVSRCQTLCENGRNLQTRCCKKGVNHDVYENNKQMGSTHSE